MPAEPPAAIVTPTSPAAEGAAAGGRGGGIAASCEGDRRSRAIGSPDRIDGIGRLFTL